MLWVEKYRPKNLNEVLGQDVGKVRELIKNPLSMPHFLFLSKSPGTGKTSYAYAIINELKVLRNDILVTNSSDERKLESIRGTVKDFARTRRTKAQIPRIILMDEFDGMTGAAQNALRYLMEHYSSNCKFILTANNEEKIIEPIMSRCVVIRIKETNKDQIADRLVVILKSENVNYENQAIKKIVDIHYPDIRQMINHLQELSSVGVTMETVKTRMELEEEFYKLLRARNPYNARKYVVEKGLDPRDLLHFTIDRMISDEKLKPTNTTGATIDESTWQTYKTKINEMVLFGAEIDYRMAVGADSEIQLFAFVLKFMSVWR